MIVDADSTVNLTNVFTLNGTAARLWQYSEGGERTAEELAVLLCEEYNVDWETALRDVRRQLAEWAEFGLISL